MRYEIKLDFCEIVSEIEMVFFFIFLLSYGLREMQIQCSTRKTRFSRYLKFARCFTTILPCRIYFIIIIVAADGREMQSDPKNFL